ncbi:glycoside hydrolase superfamily [Stachybotrys elegans]|uniref:xylan 1,4-beta-xylosidase n=1 Tax=Stachybotrys elegans TaxID=80388 RepID=A0A8K0SKZ2_9HYPO|nr:glycoside hydrolase superfamily [Stachybotrys elegans]
MHLRILAGAGLVGLALAQPYPYEFPDCGDGIISSNPVCDRSLPPSERAAAMVEAMNVTEKLANLVRSAQGAARIGLPRYNAWNEALHGVAYAPGLNFPQSPPFNAATSFPMPVLLAAAFDDDLIEKVGVVIGTEARAWANHGYSGLTYWTPNVNTFKDPRWGRGSETPGEDALRVSRYAGAMIRGLEGDKAERRIVATCKHFAGNDFEDWNGVSRHDFDARLTLQDMAEYYLLPFQQCARDSKVGSFMCAYNAVNGVPSCANDYLMGTILREHWNWTETNNYITSDCEAVLDVSANHHYVETNAEGTAICFIRGMDNSCEYESTSDIPGAWNQGLLPEEVIDRALRRTYETLISAGYFDGDSSEYLSLGWADVNTPEAQELALQTVLDGTVLLKNDGTLPLELEEGATLAMVGFWANDSSKIIGGYSGRPPYARTPVWAAQQMGYKVNVATGPILQQNCTNDTWTEAALEAARKSDYILYFGGIDTSAAGETLDRYDIDWPRAQRALLKALSKLNKPLVVVQLGDQLDNTPLLRAEGINSILWTSWPGQDGGPGIMQLITGAKSPAGRLPVTQYPASYVNDIPITEMSLRPTSETPGRTYRWYADAVQPFGYGLHYTEFKPTFAEFPSSISIQELVAGCDNAYPDTCAFPPLTVQVANDGSRTSDYVALVFLAGEYGPAPYPFKTLATYGRLRDIAAGEEATAELAWTFGDVARRDEDGNTVLYPGTYTVLLDEPTVATFEFELTGEAEILDHWPAPPTEE